MKNNSIGIDISDTTIEVVELVVQGDDIKIKAAGAALLTPGIVENGRIKNADLLAAALHEVLAGAHPHPISTGSIVFGLPESQMYTYIFDLNPYGEAERDERIRKEAYANIPLDEKELTFSYSVLREDAGGARILLVATSKEVFGEWLGFFERAGFAVTFFDVEILAAFRAMFKQHPSEPICIVDVGAAATVIAIFNSEGLQYIYSLKTAGNTMTAAIAEVFGISEKEAEERKVSMGMLGQEGKLFSVLEKSFRPVLEGIRVSFMGFQERFGREPNEIVLIGGGSAVNGIVPYFQAQFTKKIVKPGASFIQREHVPLRYIEALGLALRGLEREEDQKDPVMLSKAAISGIIPTISAAYVPKKSEKKDEKIVSVEAVMATPREIVTIRKFRFEKKIFIMILIAGALLIAFAWWFRARERAKWDRRGFPSAPSTIESMSPPASQKTLQSFNVSVPIALDEAGNNREVIQARIVTDVVEAKKGEGEEDLVARSLVNVRLKLARDEAVWAAPLPEVSEKKTIKTVSRTFQWFVYNEKQADDFLVKEAERIGNLHDYSLREIKKSALAPTDNPLLFYLTGSVTVFADIIMQ